MQSYDVVVIGGGVNGTGIARDASMRGLRVLLVEKRDFGSGSSGANSGMIHGGLRYLLFDREVTRLSSIDSGYIQRIAPHLLFRIPFIYPVMHRRPGGRRSLYERVYDYLFEVYFSAYDDFAALRNGRRHVHLTPDEAASLVPGLTRDMSFAVTFDEFGIDPFRLCALNARSAREHGADVRNYTEVTGLTRDETGRVTGARIKDLHTGDAGEVRAKIVVNAAGPWAMRLAGLVGSKLKIRPGKGVHLTLDRRLSDYGLIAHAIDGRQVMVMPHESATIIGTTDDDYYGDPDDIPITGDETAYLLEAAARVLPSVRDARVLRAWAGVRNTLYAWGPTEDDLSREHQVFDHAAEGAPGFYSFVGGKLASFRAQAEHATDVVCRALGHTAPCRTHVEPLPGGGSTPSPVELAAAHGVDAHAASRLVYRHGAEAGPILDLAKADPALAEPACRCEGTLGAELVHAIRAEGARHLVDLRRRCRLAMGPCQGAGCAAPAAALARRELGWSLETTHAELRTLLDERWKGQVAAENVDLAQLELASGALLGAGALPDGGEARPARR